MRLRIEFMRVIAMIFFIYDIVFVFMPDVLGTRMIISIIGFFYFLVKVDLRYIDKEFFKLIWLFLIGLVPILITTVINDFFDIRFFGVIFQNILYLFGAYFLVNSLKLNSFIEVSKVIVLAVLIHSIFAFIMFLMPSFFIIVMTIQKIDIRAMGVMETVNDFGSRLVGIGRGSFFSGGVFVSVALVLNLFLIKSLSNKTFWIFIYLLNIVLGFLLARIVIVGLLLSFFLIISKKNFIKVFFVSIIAVFIFLLFFVQNIEYLKSFRVIEHGFEFLFNFIETGSFSTMSSEGVKNMMFIPDNIKTILIGDGKFYNFDGSYYMHTDIGFLRVIYYYGLFGSIIYFYPHFFISKVIVRKSLKLKFLFSLLCILVLVLNVKGLADLYPFFFLFFICINFQKNENTTSYR